MLTHHRDSVAFTWDQLLRNTYHINLCNQCEIGHKITAISPMGQSIKYEYDIRCPNCRVFFNVQRQRFCWFTMIWINWRGGSWFKIISSCSMTIRNICYIICGKIGLSRWLLELKTTPEHWRNSFHGYYPVHTNLEGPVVRNQSPGKVMVSGKKSSDVIFQRRPMDVVLHWWPQPRANHGNNGA